MPQYYPFHFVPASGKSNKFTGLEFTVDQQIGRASCRERV